MSAHQKYFTEEEKIKARRANGLRDYYKNRDRRRTYTNAARRARYKLNREKEIKWNKTYRQQHLNEYVDRRLLKTYGISLAEYEAILKRQGGGCAVCGRKATTRRLAVDHEHIVGYKQMSQSEKRKHARGILCWKCNRFVISYHKKPEIFESAARYLNKWPAIEVLLK